METSDGPGINVIIGAVFVVASLLGFALFAWFAVIYRTFSRAASESIDVDRFAV